MFEFLDSKADMAESHPSVPEEGESAGVGGYTEQPR